MPYDIDNAAAFDYLQAFKDIDLPGNIGRYKGKDRASYSKLIKHLHKIQKELNDKKAKYNDPSKFQKLYTKLHEITSDISVKENPNAVLQGNLLAFHKTIFVRLYENDSKLFERIDHNLIHFDESQRGKAREDYVHERLTAHNIKKPGFFQFTHPENAVSKFFSGLLGINYNPLKNTNKPYIAFQGDDNTPTTLRMGTQIKGSDTVQNAFLNYLACKKSDSPKPIHHVYFNLLKRDAGGFERYFERVKTLALEAINAKPLGTAIITLPADSPHFLEGYNKKESKAKNNDLYKTNDLLQSLIDSIKNNKNDFYISDDIKKILFANEGDLENTVTTLFNRSMKFACGDIPPALIDAQTRQAILFDFVKFQFSNYIVKTLNPDTINFSCKDAIDRGGVHALWHEYRRRMKSGEVMDEKEFNMHLDASALLVKGRPVNDHRNLVWNTLYQSYQNNPQKHAKNPWVRQWLIENYPTTKTIKHLQHKKSLSSKQSIMLNEHNDKIEKFINALPKAPKQQLPSISKLEPSSTHLEELKHTKQKKVIGNLHRLQKKEALILEPALEQSQVNIDNLRHFLKKPENKKSLGISEVKKSKEHGHPGFSFELQEQRAIVKAEYQAERNKLLYSAKKNIPMEEYEAFALAFSNVILSTCPNNAQLDFSMASPQKRDILEKVFQAQINKAVIEGKFDERSKPKIVKSEPTFTPVKQSF